MNVETEIIQLLNAILQNIDHIYIFIFIITFCQISQCINSFQSIHKRGNYHDYTVVKENTNRKIAKNY